MSDSGIFKAAVKLPADQRAAYLDHACGDNQALRQEVESLLQAHEVPGSFLGPLGARRGMTEDYLPITERPGTCIGPYKLLQQIGEGGMGLVCMAEQERPIRRRVALKIIKPGMDSAQVSARFEVERQALALMDHTNIARVIDAGTTDSGRPYFVMELVHGVPITQYCDANKLSPRQRLELFVPVCQAIQHAHQKGVIHRDLKPSNVMVTLNDGRPVPKVIDFGVAKATEQRLTERTLFTQYGTIVGTLEYMAPEQAEMSGLGVDTRSDIYALGVLLYELLTGTTPVERSRLREAAYDEMLRLIREEEPARPSRRISTSGDRLATISAERNTEPAQLSRLVCGELDWIVMRCLEKDRTRRYDTASSLARDIQHYLADEPVEACPPSAGYRLRKFTRKHKKLLTTAAAFAALLLLGVAASAWQAVRATEAEAVAQANERQAKDNAVQAQDKEQEANQQRDEAQRQRDEAQKQRDAVRALNQKLEATQAELRSTLYAARTNLAQHAWDAAGIDRVHELLQLQMPKPGESDLRGFEWYYLNRLCHSDLFTLKHTSSVRCVAYDPDGKRLAAVCNGGPDGEDVMVWDAQTGNELLSFKGGILSIAFSPDGKRLATLSGPRQVKVWDAETGKELLALGQPKLFPGGIHSFAYSPDGKRLATGSNRELKVWNAENGEELHTFQVMGTLQSLVFSPDGKRLATTSIRDKTVKVWDAENGNELLTLQRHTGPVFSVAYSADGKRLASTSDDKTVKVWDAESGKELLTLQGHTSGIFNVAFSPDSKRLASASSDRTVKVWDAQAGHELLTVRGHSSYVMSVSFSPDGKRLASASLDKTIRVWDAQTGQNPTTLKKGGPVSSVAISPDGKRVAAAGVAPGESGKGPLGGGGEVKVWDIQTGKELHSLKGGAATVAFSPDGKLLASAGLVYEPGQEPVGEVKVWDAQTGKELHSLKGGGASVAFSPDGKLLASAGGVYKKLQLQASEVKVWDAHTGKELLTLNAGGVFPGVSSDGGGLSVAFSPDGKRLASASGKEIKFWDAQTGKELLTLKNGAMTVAYSPDGKRLASSGHPEVKVWDAGTGEELLTLKGHTDDHVGRVVYSPDGKRLVTASRDKTVKVWDAQTGLELLTLEGHGGLFNGLAFSPDGHRLATGVGDGTVKIWDATPLPEKR
jgi:WD40 repeat protein/serine/threonine protein kinase